MKTHALDIVRLNAPKFQRLSRLYGPGAIEVRRKVASLIADPSGRILIPKSDKRCQYGNLRTALLKMFSIEGTCIADEDSKFEASICHYDPQPIKSETECRDEERRQRALERSYETRRDGTGQ